MPYNTLEKKRAYNRKFYKKWYAKNGRNRAIDYMEAIAEWQKNHPEAVKAEHKVVDAVNSGKLVKPKGCSICGRRVRLSGHHDDYSKPLEVQWLCSSCHKLKHPTT